MKKKKLAVLSILLAGTLLTSCLTGCGDEKKPANSQESTQGTIDGTENIGSGTEVIGQKGEETQGTADSEEISKTYEPITSDAALVDYGSVIVIGDAGYELFTNRKETAATYAETVSKLADSLDGTAEVYDMIIPLSSAITMPDNYRDQVQSTDQEKAINDMVGLMSDNVHSVEIYDTLMEHRTEYIYFRTDHHWTTLGAYYAYVEFCKEKGITPTDISTYETKTFDGFLGSFYNDTDKDASLGANPDAVTAYYPKSEASMHVTASDGMEYDWPVIYDVSSYSSGLKYSTFIASDNPYTEIVNKTVTDGSTCVVLKESFGNAFVPFLVDHYQYIYVIDYRYWDGSVSQLVKEKGATDVILLNNLSMIRNKYLVGQFQGVVK